MLIDMNPLISIIVPVYNAEKTLGRCVNSISSQTFQDWELLLIDDGSTDRSGKLCDEYALRDQRIKVFHKENGGVSSARNIGLNHAKGKWIMFCDADDELMENCLETLTSYIQYENIDLVLAGYDMIDSSTKVLQSTSNLPYSSKQINIISAIRLIYRYEYYTCFIWAKLYKSSIIKLNNLSFDETIYYSEDRLFNVQYLCACRNAIYYTTQSVYKYYVRDNSAMTSLLNNFNYKSITGFYATLLMYKTLMNKRVTKDIIFYATEDIINSYDYTLERMKQFSIKDRGLKKSLQKKIFTTLSYKQYLLMRIRKMISVLKHKMNL